MLGVRKTKRVPEPIGSHGVTAAQDAYLTDGSRLFRVVAPLAIDHGIESAILEDCQTLAWRDYSAAELFWLHLRRVIPAEGSRSLH